MTILSPLAAIPVLFALLFGMFGCAEIIAATYGIDLASIIPLMHADLHVSAPLLLFGSAVFGLVFMVKIFGLGPSNDYDREEQEKKQAPLSRWQRCAVHFWFLIMLLALLTIPYWLALPYPEAFVVGGALIAWFAYKKLSLAPKQS